MATYKNYPTIVYENLKQMYHASAEKYGEKELFRQKVNGTYQSYSYNRYCSDVDALGTELCARGLQGKRVIVTGENCYEWAMSYMAVICGVGVVVPVDKEIPAEEIAKSYDGAAIVGRVQKGNGVLLERGNILYDKY